MTAPARWSSPSRCCERWPRQGITDVCLTPHLQAGKAEAGPPSAHERSLRSTPRLGAGASPTAPWRRGHARSADHPSGGPGTERDPRRHPIHTGRVPPPGGLRDGHQRAHPGCRAGPGAGSRSPRAVQLLFGRGGAALACGRREDCRSTPLRYSRRRLVGSVPGSSWRKDWRTFWQETTTATTGRIATGARFLEAQDGREQVELLAVRNPAAILDDARCIRCPRFGSAQSWMQSHQAVSGGEQ